MPPGEHTPTATSNHSSLCLEQQQQQEEGKRAAAAQPPPPPAFLVRLMDDYARQLKRRGSHVTGEDDVDDVDDEDDLMGSTSSAASTTGWSAASSNGESSTSTSNHWKGTGIGGGGSGGGGGRPHGSSTGSGTTPSSTTTTPPAPLPCPPSREQRVAALPIPKPIFTHGTTTPTSSTSSVSPSLNLHRLEALCAPTSLSSENEPEEELVPPENFAMVSSWVYRSSFPKKQNFPFLRSLGLKSVLTLVLEDYPEENTEFLEAEGIKFFQFGIPGNKEPFVHIPDDKIVAALLVVLDKRNHPMLIHCNKGKHRTGCLVGCLRKVQQWSLTAIFDEYRRYSFPKSRSMDQQFIEAFDLLREVWEYVDARYLPSWALPSSTGM